MSLPATDRQLQVYLFFKRYCEENGCPPHIREVCEGMDVSSTNAIHDYFRALVDKGYLRVHKTKGHRARYVLAKEEP